MQGGRDRRPSTKDSFKRHKRRDMPKENMKQIILFAMSVGNMVTPSITVQISKENPSKIQRKKQ